MNYMTFKVYAGNMFCGWLSVFKSGNNIFTNSACTAMHESRAPLMRIKAYKNLNLVRVH